MKMTKQLFFPMVVVTVIMSVLVTTTTTSTPSTEWTTGYPTADLNGKMFTLTVYRGGVTFFPPNYSPHSPYPTRGYPYTTTYPPWTTAYPGRGVSVCLRYVTDLGETDSTSVFTLSPSTTPLNLRINSISTYYLTFNGYNSMFLKPNIRIWPNTGQNIWTSVCITVDAAKKVAQMFSGSNMSIRKVLPSKYVWSGEPVIDFTGFTGQVTDVQVWDYPLRYKDILYYSSPGYYGPYPGSVLTWSNIKYSLKGDTLMEDRYEMQAKQPAERGGHRLNGKMTWTFSSIEKNKGPKKEV